MKAIGETEDLDKKLKTPIIAGGLIRSKKDVMDCLSSGAIAVSTSTTDLWNL